ncbi:sugar ABC transporter substrate-binding protein [Saccharobesus litoralis]|uniref:Sugar ABC transporter substrate-binding protein n=1 Tax=Saccharobesus litoralis TaxID=2172099 RepID=A0A2S0VS25_9ALTE|nr:polysaccharide biosynthesis/export family protein [Saccharobesus litoralis]AWB67021.1 sugar ABC transporter substrate-binding protein [Saccharobesus litoralis]
MVITRTLSLLCLILSLLSFSTQALVTAEEIKQGYKFGPGDNIKVSVYLEPDLAYDGQISQEGKIDFPLLGSVDFTGLTQTEAKQKLELMLRDGYLVNPIVAIQVKKYRPFFIYGEVRNPGSYDYQPDITLEQVLALSGGLKDRASREQWTIQRGSRKLTFKAQPHTVILPGDIIKIDKSFF